MRRARATQRVSTAGVAVCCGERIMISALRAEYPGGPRHGRLGGRRARSTRNERVGALHTYGGRSCDGMYYHDRCLACGTVGPTRYRGKEAEG